MNEGRIDLKKKKNFHLSPLTAWHFLPIKRKNSEISEARLLIHVRVEILIKYLVPF